MNASSYCAVFQIDSIQSLLHFLPLFLNEFQGFPPSPHSGGYRDGYGGIDHLYQDDDTGHTHDDLVILSLGHQLFKGIYTSSGVDIQEIGSLQAMQRNGPSRRNGRQSTYLMQSAIPTLKVDDCQITRFLHRRIIIFSLKSAHAP